jgi:hypothetical protein
VFCILVSTIDATGASANEHLHAPLPGDLTEASESGPAVNPRQIVDKPPLDVTRRPIPPIAEQLIDSQVTRGLARFQKFLKEPKKYELYSKALGFSSVEKAANAAKGKSLAVYQIPLDALINYDPDSKAHPVDLLTSNPPTVLVPLVDGQTIQSSLMIVGTGDQARIVARGPSKIFKDRTLDDLTNIDGIVKIAELHLHFFMRTEQSDIILIPIINHPFFKLEKDKEYSANKLLADLKPKALKAAQAFADDNEEPDSKRSHSQSQ